MSIQAQAAKRKDVWAAAFGAAYAADMMRVGSQEWDNEGLRATITERAVTVADKAVEDLYLWTRRAE